MRKTVYLRMDVVDAIKKHHTLSDEYLSKLSTELHGQGKISTSFSQKSLRRARNDNAKVRLEVAQSLSEILGVSLEHIIFQDDEDSAIPDDPYNGRNHGGRKIASIYGKFVNLIRRK